MKLFRTISVLGVLFIMVTCGKLNSKKDGYCTLESDHLKIKSGYCNIITNQNDSTSLYEADWSSLLYAGNLVKNGDSSYLKLAVSILFPGKSPHRWTGYDATAPFDLMVAIDFDNTQYTFPVFDSKTKKQLAEIDLNVEAYDQENGQVRGYITGKFFSVDGERFVEVEKGEFLAVMREPQ